MITLIDSGHLGERIATPSWIEFTLLPTLNQNFGTQHITHLLVLQPSIMTFLCVEKICQLCAIKNFYLPLWKGTADKRLLHSYFLMKTALEKNGTTIKRLTHAPFSPLKELTIIPLEQRIRYNDISFPVFHLKTTLPEKILEIYSAKKPK